MDHKHLQKLLIIFTDFFTKVQMKKLLSISFIALMLQSCSTQNPNPNSNGNNTTALPSVTICNQVWTTKNLDVSTYRNGDAIPQVTDFNQWEILTTGAWCYYNNDPALGAIYGKLYNWYAVNDPRGLAPTGWHVPSNSEWNRLVRCIDPSADTSWGLDGTQSQIAGGSMKEQGTNHWVYTNEGATNSSGFTALPGCLRSASGGFPFATPGGGGYFWSSTMAPSGGYAYYRCMFWGSANLDKHDSHINEGKSVRLVKD